MMRFKSAIYGLALALMLPCAAMAQNYTCPTAPVGTSNNQCASTAFVQNKIAAFTGDCTVSLLNVITCTKTNGVAFGPFATGTNAANLSGTINSNRLPGPFTNGVITGNTSAFATSTGSLTPGDCVSLDASGNFIDAGGPCTTGGGGGTVAAGFTNQLGVYAADGTTISGLATGNSGVLVTDGSGVPSIATTLPSGLTLDAFTLAGTLSGGGHQINNVAIGTSSPGAGSFSTLAASSTVSGTGFSSYLASPPAIGGTAPAAAAFTTLSATGNLTTNVTGSTQCLHANSSGVMSGTGSDCGSGGGGRTILTTNADFYIATTGSDSNPGTSGSPWRHLQYARNTVSQKYDVAGFNVTYHVAAGTYDDPLFCAGSLVGQQGINGSSELWQGAGSGSTIIKVNPASGSPAYGNVYAIGLASGCKMMIQGMKLDQSLSANDTINLGDSGSILQIGTDITFGYNIYPWNDISDAIGALLVVSGNINLSKPLFSTTATWTSGSNTLTVASCSGVVQYMGVLGTNIPAGAYVGSCIGTTLTLAYGAFVPVTATTGSGTGATIYFMSGGNAFLSLGNGAKAFWVGNGDPATSLQVIWANQAYYQQAIILADGNGGCNCQAMTFGYDTAIYALPFLAINGGQIDTNFQGMQYFPGIVGQFNTLTATGSINTNTLTLSSTSGVFRGNSINAETCVAGTFTSGSTAITTSYTLAPGDKKYITGPGIAGGTQITNATGGTAFTISTPTLAANTGVTLCYTLAGIPPGTYITYISGTTVGLSQYLTAAISAGTPVYVGGMITSNGGYD